MVSIGSHKKVVWKGKCGHEWSASVKNRVKGSGCPYCSHNQVLEGFNDLASQMPKVAAEWSEKNYPLRPTMVTVYTNRKVWWKCKEGHEWNTQISTRSYGSKCPYCSGEILLSGFNDFGTRQPRLAVEWSKRNHSLTPDMIKVVSNLLPIFLLQTLYFQGFHHFYKEKSNDLPFLCQYYRKSNTHKH